MRFIVLFLCLLPLSVMANQPQQFSSSDQRAALVELYTSEGCSSCPPADKWLSGLKDHEQLWSGFVPLAFHVDYWDYIGWPDKFADPEYSLRQRRYAQQYGERTVYTPGVRKTGNEWRFWRFRDDPAEADAPRIGQLKLQVEADGSFSATFKPLIENISKQPLRLTVALLGMEIQTEVERGENSGRTLDHDFVVLATNSFDSNEFSWQGNMPASALTAPRYAVAAWVSGINSLTPIQATGGFLR